MAVFLLCFAVFDQPSHCCGMGFPIWWNLSHVTDRAKLRADATREGVSEVPDRADFGRVQRRRRAWSKRGGRKMTLALLLHLIVVMRVRASSSVGGDTPMNGDFFAKTCSAGVSPLGRRFELRIVRGALERHTCL
jgi:hypothetical protein